MTVSGCCLLLSIQLRRYHRFLPHVQVYGDAQAAQVVDPQHRADHISSQIVKYQHFPYWLALGIQYGRRL